MSGDTAVSSELKILLSYLQIPRKKLSLFEINLEIVMVVNMLRSAYNFNNII